MAHQPAFQFYPSDFRSDAKVSAMTFEEVGVYILLLTFCWTEGSIPSDKKALCRLLKCDIRTLDRIWPALAPCFTLRGDAYIQGRLEREREKQSQYRAKQAEKGRASGVARNRRETDTNREATEPEPQTNRGSTEPQPDAQPEANSSSSSSSSIFDQPPAVAAAAPRFVGKQKPIPGYRRLRVFPWMVEETLGMLGEHADEFDLDKWLLLLDSSGRVLPPNLWPWIKEAVSADAAARGFGAAAVSNGTHTNIDAVRELLRRDGVIE